MTFCWFVHSYILLAGADLPTILLSNRVGGGGGAYFQKKVENLVDFFKVDQIDLPISLKALKDTFLTNFLHCRRIFENTGKKGLLSLFWTVLTKNHVFFSARTRNSHSPPASLNPLLHLGIDALFEFN